jgi:hypothetical protein
MGKQLTVSTVNRYTTSVAHAALWGTEHSLLAFNLVSVTRRHSHAHTCYAMGTVNYLLHRLIIVVAYTFSIVTATLWVFPRTHID